MPAFIVCAAWGRGSVPSAATCCVAVWGPSHQKTKRQKRDGGRGRVRSRGRDDAIRCHADEVSSMICCVKRKRSCCASQECISGFFRCEKTTGCDRARAERGLNFVNLGSGFSFVGTDGYMWNTFECVPAWRMEGRSQNMVCGGSLRSLIILDLTFFARE